MRSDGQHRWACRKSPGEDGRCGRVFLRSGELESFVIDAFVEAVDTPKLSKGRKRPAGAQSDPADRLHALESDLEALAADHGSGLISRREWMAARAGIEPRIDALRAELTTATAVRSLAPLRNVRNVRAAFDALDLDAQRAALAAVIDHVDIASARRPGATAFDPKRVKIVWKI